MSQTQEASRTYEGLWNEIKKKKSCSIQPANTSDALFKKIKLAVIKEKCNDTGFKFEMLENEQRAKLEVHRAKNGIITFKLKLSLGIDKI